jgi:pimeloyl-ACP methyl ester carboxylesterase
MGLQFWLGLVETWLRLHGVRRRRFDRPSGGHLSYLEAGRGEPTLVLVHGLGSSNMTWVRVLRRLARRHRVLALDLPGYGKSPLPQGKNYANVSDLSDALVEFLHGPAATGRVILIGQSMGGWVSTKAARNAPGSVRELVLVNTAGVLYEGIEQLREILSPMTRAEVEAFWKRVWFRTPRYYRPFWKEAAQHLQAPSVRGFLESLQESDFINEDLPRLEVPVTVIWGRADSFIPAQTVDLIVDAVQSTRVYWMARCGHIPPLERPREFVTLVDAVARSDDASPLPPAEARRRLRLVKRAKR